MSFYDSDESTEDLRRSSRSSRIKESPFKIIKSARSSKPHSPAVSSPASRRTSSRRTPKVRLRHDNSQIQFEAIASSPSNPFVQESQILTERQKEMIERHRLSGGLFTNMDAPPPQQRDAPPSPLDLHSDLQSVDDLPIRDTRTTPLKPLAKMGPMDVFLGSSPTPHARRNSQKIVSDDTDIATPTAVRTVRVADHVDLGSSPPRFERHDVSKPRQPPEESVVGYESRQPGDRYSASFDDGTTMDEEALAAAITLAEEKEQLNMQYEPDDDIMSDVPSFTTDSELTAQIDADMQTADTTNNADETVQESHSVFIDAASHFMPHSNNTATQDGSDTEVESTPKTIRKRKGRKSDPGSTSRVLDSFASTPGKNTPGSQDLRRSTRHSMGSPIHIQLPLKRQKKPRRNKAKSTEDEEASTPHRAQPEAADKDPATMIPAPPLGKVSRAKKRKSMDDSPIASECSATTPESGRERGIRRTQSNLSQVQSAADVAVEDSHAPAKRARQSLNMDVSEARATAPPSLQESNSSQSQRLSHVQVTPRHDKAATPAVDEQIAASIATVTNTDPVAKQPLLVQSQIQSQQQTPTGSATPNRSFAERVILTPRSIINKFKELRNYFLNAHSLAVTEEEEREMDDALFHIRRGVHAAGQRGINQGLQEPESEA